MTYIHTNNHLFEVTVVLNTLLQTHGFIYLSLYVYMHTYMYVYEHEGYIQQCVYQSLYA